MPRWRLPKRSASGCVKQGMLDLRTQCAPDYWLWKEDVSPDPNL